MSAGNAGVTRGFRARLRRGLEPLIKSDAGRNPRTRVIGGGELEKLVEAELRGPPSQRRCRPAALDDCDLADRLAEVQENVEAGAADLELAAGRHSLNEAPEFESRVASAASGRLSD